MTPTFDLGRKSIMESLIKFFDEDDWRYQQIENLPILEMRLKGENGTWSCYAQAKEENRTFIYYSILDINVPEEKRQTAAEYLCRANWGLLLGNFELDFRRGEVRYKTSVCVEDGQLTHEMIKRVVYTNIIMMDKYLPGLLSVVFQDKPPAEACAEVEDGA